METTPDTITNADEATPLISRDAAVLGKLAHEGFDSTETISCWGRALIEASQPLRTPLAHKLNMF